MKETNYLPSVITSNLIVLVASLIEFAILSNISYLPAVPDLCLLCILFISIQDGKLIGETSGFVSGLCLDFLGTGPFGLNCLYRTIFGYLGGCFNKIINTNGIFIPCLLAFVATIVKALLLLLIGVLFPLIKIPFSPFTNIFLIEIIENIILAPFLFIILNLFKKTLILKPEAVI